MMLVVSAKHCEHRAERVRRVNELRTGPSSSAIEWGVRGSGVDGRWTQSKVRVVGERLLSAGLSAARRRSLHARSGIEAHLSHVEGPVIGEQQHGSAGSVLTGRVRAAEAAREALGPWGQVKVHNSGSVGACKRSETFPLYGQSHWRSQPADKPAHRAETGVCPVPGRVRQSVARTTGPDSPRRT